MCWKSKVDTCFVYCMYEVYSSSWVLFSSGGRARCFVFFLFRAAQLTNKRVLLLTVRRLPFCFLLRMFGMTVVCIEAHEHPLSVCKSTAVSVCVERVSSSWASSYGSSCCRVISDVTVKNVPHQSVVAHARILGSPPYWTWGKMVEKVNTDLKQETRHWISQYLIQTTIFLKPYPKC